LFEQLAMRRLVEAHELHRRAIKGGSAVAWHRLRIGIKRLRYAVENFLPDVHRRWARDLNTLQDALGDVHDLDVLWDELSRARLLEDPATRATWRQRIDQVREQRLATYRQLMVGPGSRWQRWEALLLQPPRVARAALASIAAWGEQHGSDPARSAWLGERSTALLDLAAALAPRPPGDLTRLGTLAAAAACLHGLAGRGKRGRVFRSARKLPVALGWSSRQRDLCALAVADSGRRRSRVGSVGVHPRLSADEQRCVEWVAAALGTCSALAGPGDPLPTITLTAAAGELRLATDGAPARGVERQLKRLRKALGVPVELAQAAPAGIAANP
ncbi:MAG TPA: CHAD domain-containing protein, partial [Gammaproteobacteria bacterium]